jgi:hypothetical protein
MKLYEIANEYEFLLNQTFDVETGELNEQALIKLDQIVGDIKNKGIAVASYIKNIDAERKAIEEAKKCMAEREAKLNNRVNYLTSYLQQNMERCGLNEISCPYFSVRLKKCPLSVDVSNEELIPDDCKRKKEVTSIDKIKIRDKILQGISIPGATIRQNNRLEIK